MSVKANLKQDSSELINSGDFRWQESAQTYIIFVCPCGCGDRRCLPVTGDKRWIWDGNKETPTLTPSILYLDGCGWHGFLTNGEFIQC